MTEFAVQRTPLSRAQKIAFQLGLSGVGVVLAWLVATYTLAGALAITNPSLALKLRSQNPVALTALAEKLAVPKATTAITTHEDAKQHLRNNADAIRANLKQALRRDPLKARSLNLLGQLSEAEGDLNKASALFRLSAKLSIHESYALYWLMQFNFTQGNYDEAIQDADALLRTTTDASPLAVPILTAIAEKPKVSALVKNLIAANPPWRSQFLTSMQSFITDARTPLDLFQSLRQTQTPPDLSEVQPYLDFLVSKGFGELAYYVWLQFLPPEQLAHVGHLYNGSFETLPSGGPFDWRVSERRNILVDFVRRPDRKDQKALFLEFGLGKIDFNMQQTLVLSPGSYHMQGKISGYLVGKRGLRWRVKCLGSTLLGESEQLIGATSGWANFDFAFKVPDDACKLQQLSLSLDARSASEQLASGKIWFDELSISPIAP